MRRFVLVGFLLTLFSSMALAQAQTPAAPSTRVASTIPQVPAVPGTKIAVIDFEMVVLESDAGKAATGEFNKQMEPEKARFDKLEKEIQDLQKKAAEAKTDAEKTQLRNELDSKNREGQRTQEDAARKAEDLRNKLLAPIAAAVNRMVDRYAKANNLAVVFDPNTEPTNIIFANKAADITSDVMRILNEEYAKDPKLTPPAATTPAAPAK